MVKQVKY